MNLVRLQYGGGGSDIEPYTVIVTLDDKFAGQTVTMSQSGQETLRKTCPTSAPYEVTFKPMYSGVWAVSSTTIDGRVSTKNTDELLEWGTYTVQLKIEFNFEKWLTRGRVTETFASLDDVLADEKTIRQLMTVHDSVDYLVSVCSADSDTANTILSNDLCAKWINLRDYALDTLWDNATVKAIMDETDKYGYGEWALIDGTWQPKGNVPIMTSNTTPYGTTVGNTSGNRYYAFDGNESTSISMNDSNSLGYKFVNPINIKRIYIKTASTVSFDIAYSKDGSNWENGETVTSNSYVNIEDYGYIMAIAITAKTGTSVSTLQFYGRQLNVSVPKMTSNTAPYGEVFSSPISSGFDAYKAFDSDTSINSRWVSAVGKDAYIGYDFGKDIAVKCAYVQIYTSSTGTFEVQVSDTKDSGYIGVGTMELNVNNGSLLKQLTINNAYRYCRVYATAPTNTGVSGVQLTNVQFYGVDYSEREFEPNSNVKYIYDHGVELMELTPYISNANCKAEKRTNELYCHSGGGGFVSAGFYTKNEIDITANILHCANSGLELSTNIIVHYRLLTGARRNMPIYYGNDTCDSTITAERTNYTPPVKGDISKVNGLHSLMLSSYNGTDNASITYTITEWWLE